MKNELLWGDRNFKSTVFTIEKSINREGCNLKQNQDLNYRSWFLFNYLYLMFILIISDVMLVVLV
jgi:hypothetical protein